MSKYFQTVQRDVVEEISHFTKPQACKELGLSEIEFDQVRELGHLPGVEKGGSQVWAVHDIETARRSDSFLGDITGIRRLAKQPAPEFPSELNPRERYDTVEQVAAKLSDWVGEQVTTPVVLQLIADGLLEDVVDDDLNPVVGQTSFTSMMKGGREMALKIKEKQKFANREARRQKMSKKSQEQTIADHNKLCAARNKAIFARARGDRSVVIPPLP